MLQGWCDRILTEGEGESGQRESNVVMEWKLGLRVFNSEIAEKHRKSQWVRSAGNVGCVIRGVCGEEEASRLYVCIRQGK